MATIVTIGKARGVGAILQQVTGVEPSYEYGPDYVRIYFQPDRLKQVQQKLAEWEATAAGPSDVRVDWFPAVMPLAVKKSLPLIGGLLLAGYILGRM